MYSKLIQISLAIKYVATQISYKTVPKQYIYMLWKCWTNNVVQQILLGMLEKTLNHERI